MVEAILLCTTCIVLVARWKKPLSDYESVRNWSCTPSIWMFVQPQVNIFRVSISAFNSIRIWTGIIFTWQEMLKAHEQKVQVQKAFTKYRFTCLWCINRLLQTIVSNINNTVVSGKLLILQPVYTSMELVHGIVLKNGSPPFTLATMQNRCVYHACSLIWLMVVAMAISQFL